MAPRMRGPDDDEPIYAGASFASQTPLEDAEQKLREEQAEAERARREWNYNYKNGGPVIKAGYKHAHPTFIAYGKTGDSSLLAKKRNK